MANMTCIKAQEDRMVMTASAVCVYFDAPCRFLTMDNSKNMAPIETMAAMMDMMSTKCLPSFCARALERIFSDVV